MVVSLFVFLFFIFVTPVFEHNGESYKEEKGAKTQSFSQISLASICQGPQSLDKNTTGINQDQIANAPFEGSNVDTQNFNCNVEAGKRSVALLELQQAQQVQYQLLRRLRWSLGGLHGPYFCASQPAPAAKTSTAVFSASATVGIVREILFKLDATGNMARAEVGRLGEGFNIVTQFLYQKISAILKASSRTSSTTQSARTSSAYQTQQGQRQRQQRFERTERQRKACHRTSTMVLQHDTGICADVGYASAVQSGGQVARDCVGAQEERRSRIADTCKRGRRSAKQNGHLQTPQGCHDSWRCQNSSLGSPSSKGKSPCVLETIPRVSNHDMAILHRRFRQGGQTPRGAHRSGRLRSTGCTKLPRRGKEGSHRGGATGSNRDHRGRRRRLGQDCKVEPSHARRAQGHARRLGAAACENGRDWRRIRKQTQKGGRWQKVICHAAFWWGRSLGLRVNDQWPVDTSCSILKWGHTCIYENNFLSPWQAVDDAMKLSVQLGSWHERSRHTQVPTPRTRRRLSSIDPALQLSFDECVEIAIFPDDDAPDFSQPFKTTMTLSSMADWQPNEGKPWSKKRRKKSDRNGTQTLWPISQFRISDAWHDPLPEGLQHHGDPAQEEDPDVIPDPIGAPQFVHDLFTRAEEHGAFSDLDSDGDMHIRTWYLHHEGFQFCEHPKFLEFSEDWRRWERDISFAWRHWLRPDEEIQIHVIQPDPYRGYLHRPIHADVVISQGHWMRRFSTLTTIHHHHHQHPPFSYAVACSLPRNIGGVTLATAANVDVWCQQPSLRCRTTFAWIDIPFSLVSTHIVQHGQAFAITILDSLSIANIASSSSTPAIQVPQCESDNTL